MVINEIEVDSQLPHTFKCFFKLEPVKSGQNAASESQHSSGIQKRKFHAPNASQIERSLDLTYLSSHLRTWAKTRARWWMVSRFPLGIYRKIQAKLPIPATDTRNPYCQQQRDEPRITTTITTPLAIPTAVIQHHPLLAEEGEKALLSIFCLVLI